MFLKLNFSKFFFIYQFGLACSLSMKSAEFLSEIVLQRFSECTVIFIDDNIMQFENLKNDEHPGDFSNGILQKIAFSANNDVYLISRINSLSVESQFKNSLQRFGNVHKHNNNCILSIISVNKIYPEMFSRLFNFIVPPADYISKKDEDYYIFVSQKENVIKQALQSSVFSMKIKYKVAVVENDDGKTSVHSLCTDCKSGTPLLVTINVNFESSTAPETSLLFPDYLQNFNGYVIRVSSPTRIIPRVQLRPNLNQKGKYLALRGLYKDVIENGLQRKYNFTYDIFPASGGGGTGTLLENGTWVGCVGDVLSEVAHVGLVTGQTFDRSNLVGYSFPVEYEFLTFTSGPQNNIFTWKAILWPFSITMWLCTIAMIIFIIFFFLFLFKKSAQFGGKETKIEEIWSFWTVFAYIGSSFLEQGARTPRGDSVRTFAVFWLLFAVVVACVYRSKLVGFLAFPLIEQPPSTFEELSESSFESGLLYFGGAAYHLLKSAKNPTYVKIFKKMSLENDTLNCFIRALNSKFSCISYRGVADFVLSRNLSDRFGRNELEIAPDSTFFIAIGFVMEKRAIFRTNFDKVIAPVIERGLAQEWINKDYTQILRRRIVWEKLNGINSDIKTAAGSIDLTLKHFSGAFFILGYGLVAAFLFFIFEKSRFSKVLCRKQIPLLDGKPFSKVVIKKIVKRRPSHSPVRNF